MRVTILTVGSRGDVQPYIPLGLGLKAAGHQVRLATHAEFATFVGDHGLDFAPVEGDPRAVLAGEAGQKWMASGRNSLTFIRQLRQVVQPVMDRFLNSCWEACQGTEAIIFSAFGIPGLHTAERLGVPCCAALLQPGTRTRAFPSVLAPVGGPGPTNWLTHLVAEQLFWQPFRPGINRWRRRLGLPPTPFTGPYGRVYQARIPFLYGFSPSVLPKPADWPAWHHVTGYWFLDRPAAWQPPADLVRFLAAGPPPVSIGFGSMAAGDAPVLTRMALAALRMTGQRGVLLAGWSGFGRTDLPPDVFAIEAVPHDWLFPRVAATIHHGGAGTTGAGLRAGVPSIIVPFFSDQPFWGRRVAALGAGPAPIPRRQLTAERLAAAIRRATGDEAMRARAAAVGARIRAEDGVGAAVAVFEQEMRNA